MYNTSAYKFIKYIMFKPKELIMADSSLRTGIDAIDSFGTPIAIPRSDNGYFILGMNGIERYVSANWGNLHAVNNLGTQGEVSQLVSIKDSCIVVIDRSESQLRIRKYNRASNDLDTNSLSLSQENLTHVIVCSISDNGQIPGNLEAPVYMAQKGAEGFEEIILPRSVANNQVFPMIDALEVDNERLNVILEKREDIKTALGYAKNVINRGLEKREDIKAELGYAGDVINSGPELLWDSLVVDELESLFERVLCTSSSRDTSEISIDPKYDKLRVRCMDEEVVLFYESSDGPEHLDQAVFFTKDGFYVYNILIEYKESKFRKISLNYRDSSWREYFEVTLHNKRLVLLKRSTYPPKPNSKIKIEGEVDFQEGNFEPIWAELIKVSKSIDLRTRR